MDANDTSFVERTRTNPNFTIRYKYCETVQWYMRSIECPSCGSEYKQIGLHWNRSSCPKPELTERQIEIIKGLLLGDAGIHSTKETCAFKIGMTNKVFLDWLHEQLNPLSRGVELELSGEEKKKEALQNGLKGVSEDSEFSDFYKLRTVASDGAKELRGWYSSGKKRYPDKITRGMFKYWYICDGWDCGRYIAIRCIDQSDRPDHTINLIEDIGLDVTSFDVDRGIIRISAQSSRDFLDDTDPVPGFEYKWDITRPEE